MNQAWDQEKKESVASVEEIPFHAYMQEAEKANKIPHQAF